MYNNVCFSTTTAVTRTRLSIALYVHCLCCLCYMTKQLCFLLTPVHIHSSLRHLSLIFFIYQQAHVNNSPVPTAAIFLRRYPFSARPNYWALCLPDRKPTRWFSTDSQQHNKEQEDSGLFPDRGTGPVTHNFPFHTLPPSDDKQIYHFAAPTAEVCKIWVRNLNLRIFTFTSTTPTT